MDNLEGSFMDAKLLDIPNTVSGAIKAITDLEPAMVNVHCFGGVEMMEKAKNSVIAKANLMGIDAPKVIAVTVLTSMGCDSLAQILNTMLVNPVGPSSGRKEYQAEAVRKHALHLAILAKEAGLDGVVCSPHEITAIRKACGPDFLIVTPGVRPAGADVNDQKRVMTPGEAISLGADYLVIGRPITQADNPAKAANEIAAETEAALCIRHSGRDPESSKPDEPGMLRSGVPFPPENMCNL